MNFIQSFQSIGQSIIRPIEIVFSKTKQLIDFNIIFGTFVLLGALSLLRYRWSKKNQANTEKNLEKTKSVFNETLKGSSPAADNAGKKQPEGISSDVTPDKKETRPNADSNTSEVEAKRNNAGITANPAEVKPTEKKEITGHQEKSDFQNMRQRRNEKPTIPFRPPPPSIPYPSNIPPVSGFKMGYIVSLPQLKEAPPFDFQEILTNLDNITLATMEQKKFLQSNDESCREPQLIGPPEETHVKMKGDTDVLYLNANHVRIDNTHFIAMQCPMPDQNAKFWKMCEKEKVSLIVDLTREIEKRVVTYVPSVEEKYGSVRVSKVDPKNCQNVNENMSTYKVEMTNDEANTFSIPKLNYSNWYDQTGSIPVEDLYQLLNVIEPYAKEQGKPIAVHCRVGIGRTPTFIVAYLLKKRLETRGLSFPGSDDKTKLVSEIQFLILQIRKERSPDCIQTPDQIELLFNFGLYVLEKAKH